MFPRCFRTSIASLALALCLCLGAAQATAEPHVPILQEADGWRVLDLEVDGFDALFPGKPMHVLESTDTIVGSVKASRYVYKTANAFFSVERHRLPRLGRMLAPAALILNKAKDEILDSRKGVEVSYVEIDASDQSARVLQYHDEGDAERIATTELHLVGRDLYLVTAQPADGEDKPSVIRRFFESFKLLSRD